MFGGPSGMSRLMSQDQAKASSVRQTLRRLAVYFKPYTLQLLVVGVLLIASTWAQVTVPKLIGTTVDCYLTPVNLATTGDTPAQALSSFTSGASQAGAERCGGDGGGQARDEAADAKHGDEPWAQVGVIGREADVDTSARA